MGGDDEAARFDVNESVIATGHAAMLAVGVDASAAADEDGDADLAMPRERRTTKSLTAELQLLRVPATSWPGRKVKSFQDWISEISMLPSLTSPTSRTRAHAWLSPANAEGGSGEGVGGERSSASAGGAAAHTTDHRHRRGDATREKMASRAAPRPWSNTHAARGRCGGDRGLSPSIGVALSRRSIIFRGAKMTTCHPHAPGITQGT